MKTAFGFLGLFAGIFVGVMLTGSVPFLSFVCIIGGMPLGRYIGGCLEEEKAAREKMEREQERRRREEQARRQREEDLRLQAEIERIHRNRMETDPLYRRQQERAMEEERRRAEEQRRLLEERRRREEEEARRKDEERRRSLAGKFHCTSISGFRAAYRYDYYPVNRYPHGTISVSAESARRAVWNFKDGMSSIGVRVLSEFLDGNFTREEMKNIAVCVIPASTKLKNEIRYKSMCAKVASELPVRNGFGYISIAEDRQDSRTAGKSGNTTANLVFSPEVAGKDIVLFDDVTTRGTSFAQAAAELKRRGARSVQGLFIGKTV